jgi:hypothetical protein
VQPAALPPAAPPQVQPQRGYYPPPGYYPQPVYHPQGYPPPGYGPPPQVYHAPPGAVPYVYYGPHPPRAELVPPDDPAARSAASYKRMRKAGMIMTFVGLGTAALGGILMGVAAANDGSRGLSSGFNMAFGALFLAGGGVVTLVGVPLWAVGASNSKP